MSNKLPSPYHQVPAHLLHPLWLRSRESLNEHASVYDPIATKACFRCRLAPECLRGDIDQQQLLHISLTLLCDQRVSDFLARHPQGLVINVGAGLDTRFYRLDNGLCHWLELDVSEHLMWRQRLFHRSERYLHQKGCVSELSWLEHLPLGAEGPVLVVCETALLDCSPAQVATFMQKVACHFTHAELCCVLGGDQTLTSLGKALGAGVYAHGIADIDAQLLQWLPWAQQVSLHSPLEMLCSRWQWWHRLFGKIKRLKYRYTPVVASVRW